MFLSFDKPGIDLKLVTNSVKIVHRAFMVEWLNIFMSCWYSNNSVKTGLFNENINFEQESK